MPALVRAMNAAIAGPVPQEALDFFEAKELRPGFNHLDVWSEEHLRAFTAAKFMREDVLGVMQASLATALREGQTYELWARGLQPELVRLGFWGQQRVVDPLTGQEVEVDVPRRLEHIFRQNMRTARAAGQWERIQRTKASHPYLIYLLGPSERHRPQHAAWHGTLLPVDDPFWQTAFPPNGHGCRCFVRHVTSREADRMERDGVRSGERTVVLDADGNPTGRRTTTTVPVRRVAPPIVLVPFENKRTGQIEMVPEGIDPGFAHPPSQLRRFQGGPNRPPTAPAVPAAPAPAATERGRQLGVQPVTVERFQTAFQAAMQGNPRRAFVSHYSAEELAGMEAVLLDATERAGVAIKNHGDGRIEATALFNEGGPANAGASLLEEVVAQHGVNYLECYSRSPERGLEAIYIAAGFESVARYPFDEAMAPADWDYEKHGRPDYVIMRLRAVAGGEDQ